MVAVFDPAPRGQRSWGRHHCPLNGGHDVVRLRRGWAPRWFVARDLQLAPGVLEVVDARPPACHHGSSSRRCKWGGQQKRYAYAQATEHRAEEGKAVQTTSPTGALVLMCGGALFACSQSPKCRGKNTSTRSSATRRPAKWYDGAHPPYPCPSYCSHYLQMCVLVRRDDCICSQ